MSDTKSIERRSQSGFIGRLRRDVRGNTLALIAAAIIPLAGMVGGGIDMSRMYITKTRLQHACDAGALAGRKAMGGGAWNQSNNAPNALALQFFDDNFQSGAYGSDPVTRSFSENAGKVSGTASTVLPMTLMRVLGMTTQALSVTCEADMRLPNTDVMFVLDNTGSMADILPGDTISKIDSLKTSVKCFYEIVARIKTNATCATASPTGGTSSQTQIRFGFVPYTTNVNVGKLLPTSWFADTWNYQTREAVYSTTTGKSWVQQGSPVVTNSNVTQNGVPQGSCNNAAAAAAGYNSTTTTYSGPGNNTKLVTDVFTNVTGWSASNNGTCTGVQTTTKTTYLSTNTTQKTFSSWHYAQLPVNVGLLKNGTSWNSSFQWPIGPNGANATIPWDGCVEERQTVSQASYSPIPSGAKDLDIDSVPTPGDVTTQWKPVLPSLIQTRNGNSGWTLAQSTTTADYGSQATYGCPNEARKLQAWPDPAPFDTYVDSMYAGDNTYHDIGLLWGARLMSPTGLFAAENALTPAGGEIQRNMIFMTDGDPCTDPGNYTAYGVNWFDRRQVDPSVAPTGGCTTTGTLTAQVNARTTALCAAIKNKNITVWVITFGYVDPNTVTRLTNCASPGRYFSANNAAQMQSAFASIANQISQLRLTQ